MAKVSDYLKIREAARYVGVSTDTLRPWDAAGKLKARRLPISNFRLYLQSDLDRFLAQLKRCTSPLRSHRRRSSMAKKRV